MKHSPSPVAIVSCLMAVSLVMAQRSGIRTQLGNSRTVALPARVILDERATPLLSSSGKIGFISSVTDGTLISFSLTSGRIISSVVVGDAAGAISMVESSDRRLIAVPAANDPERGRPATVSVVDATSARALEPVAVVELPPDAHLTPTSRALLTSDGRYGVIASSFNEPALFSFNVQTGQVISRHQLTGRPSEIAFYERREGERVGILAITSSAANTLSIINLGDSGALEFLSSFTPAKAKFEDFNNAAFSSDGRMAFVAASEGERLFAIDAASGTEISSIDLSPAPQRITVALNPNGTETIAVTRIRREGSERPAGVTIVTGRSGRLSIAAEFTPPDQIGFSRANNAVFGEGASVAFVGSSSGILFAFSCETGELQSHQVIGGELLRIALNHRNRTIAAVRRTPTSDEIVVVGFELTDPDQPDSAVPRIDSLKPDVVEQGRSRSLSLAVGGENLHEGSCLLVGGSELATRLIRKGKAVAARLPKSLFNESRDLEVRIKAADGSLSLPTVLKVTRPNDPVIDGVSPGEVPGPTGRFALKVIGKNFRPSSTIYVGGHALNTGLNGTTRLQAFVPSTLTRGIGSLAVEVRDAAVPGVVSNEKQVRIFGPRIDALRPSSENIIAGAGGFLLNIRGSNFREGAHVEINGTTVPSSRVRRLSSALITVGVPGRLTREAGKLAVVVRNPEGNASDPKEIEAHAPQIIGFRPDPLLAGTRNIAVNVRGSFFRKYLRVLIADKSGNPLPVEQSRVRFRSSARVTVRISGELNELMEQPGRLTFQVLNPNNGSGVLSLPVELEVAGPEVTQVVIKPVEGEESKLVLILAGAHFRDGAEVEFLKGSDTVRRQSAVKVKSDELITVIGVREVDALGRFQVRVVNPGEVRSNAVRPEG